MVVATFALVAGVIIASARVTERVHYDQKLYHEPTVRQFAQELPAVSVWDYLSATTPGYHLAIAAVAKWISDDVRALQLASASIGAAFFSLLGWGLAWGAKGGGAHAPLSPLSQTALHRVWMPTLVAFTVMASFYVLAPAVFVLPDLAGLLGVLAITLIAFHPHHTHRRLVLGGLVLVGLVLVRQSHVWAAAMLWVSAWMDRPINKLTDEEYQLSRPTLRQQFFTQVESRIAMTALAALCTLPAFATLWLFHRYWGGLVPPRFQGWYPSPSPLRVIISPAPAFFLAVVGMFAPFFVGFWTGPLRRVWRQHRSVLLAVLAVAFVLLLTPPTTEDYDAGRRSGLWTIAGKLPQVAKHSSILIVGLGLLGAASLTGMLAGQRPRKRWIAMTGVFGFFAALGAGTEIWQRYTEPVVLLFLALLAANMRERFVASDERSIARRLVGPARLLGPAILALALGARSVNSILSSTTRVTDAPPAATSPDHRGKYPPLGPRTQPPPGKHFWPAS
jgi:hypothetical protein